METALSLCRTYRPSLSVAHLVSAVLVSLLVSIDLFGPSGRYWESPSMFKEYVNDGQRYLQSGGAIAGGTHMVKFTSELKWEAWNIDTTATWKSMLPKDPLGQDDNFNDGIPYGLGMFHQVHCLHSIREHYTSLLYVNGTTEQDREIAKSEAQLRHISHCFNWIRQVRRVTARYSISDIAQALLCHADRHREVLVESSAHGRSEKYARTCGNSDVLYKVSLSLYRRCGKYWLTSVILCIRK